MANLRPVLIIGLLFLLLPIHALYLLGGIAMASALLVRPNPNPQLDLTLNLETGGILSICSSCPQLAFPQQCFLRGLVCGEVQECGLQGGLALACNRWWTWFGGRNCGSQTT